MLTFDTSIVLMCLKFKNLQVIYMKMISFQNNTNFLIVQRTFTKNLQNENDLAAPVRYIKIKIDTIN